MIIIIKKVYAVIKHYENNNYDWEKEVMETCKTEEDAEKYINRQELHYLPDSTYWTIEIQYKQKLEFDQNGH